MSNREIEKDNMDLSIVGGILLLAFIVTCINAVSISVSSLFLAGIFFGVLSFLSFVTFDRTTEQFKHYKIVSLFVGVLTMVLSPMFIIAGCFKWIIV